MTSKPVLNSLNHKISLSLLFCALCFGGCATTQEVADLRLDIIHLKTKDSNLSGRIEKLSQEISRIGNMRLGKAVIIDKYTEGSLTRLKAKVVLRMIESNNLLIVDSPFIGQIGDTILCVQ